MALKPTIYKLRIALSDLERNYYDQLNLTIALHPSETTVRMVARVLAFCLNASSELTFTKGLSDIEQPDIWRISNDEHIELWIEVGEPDAERVKKATRKADCVKIYSFNTKSQTWWEQNSTKLNRYSAEIIQFEFAGLDAFAGMLTRGLDCSITITGQTAFVACAEGETEIVWQTLQTGGS